MRKLHPTSTLRRHSLGVTLIELMVAVAIGAFLMIGAMNVFMQSRTTFRINQSVSRLQENARFVLATLEPDIRMASYFGLETRGSRITGRALTTAPNNGALWPGICGANWPLDLVNPVVGSNSAYPWACGASGGGPLPGTDTLLIRRVNDTPATTLPLKNALYVQSSRSQAGQIFIGPAIPAGAPPGSQPFALITNGYYIARQSTSLGQKGTTIPSLRRKRLDTDAVGVIDEEILAGVEDLQIELGIDTDAPGAANRGSVDRYVNPNDPVFVVNPNTVVLAVRVWLRLRAEDIENGFTDTTNYVYADQNVPAPNDSFRRLLVSKTIYLRNARPMS